MGKPHSVILHYYHVQKEPVSVRKQTHWSHLMVLLFVLDGVEAECNKGRCKS